MQDKLSISRRSVYRLLEALDELGYPYYNKNEGQRESCFKLVERGENLRWWLPPPSLSFDLEDRVVLDYLFASNEVSQGLEEPIARLRKKLALIGASVGYSLEPKMSGAGGNAKDRKVLRRADVVGKHIGEAGRAALTILFEAAEKRRVCVVSYAAMETGEVKTYRIHPLTLFDSDGGLYVFVEVPRFGSIRILAVERIHEIEATDDYFSPPKGFDAEKRLSDPFGIILDAAFKARIRFSEEQAPYIAERDWQGLSTLATEADGSLIFEIETASAFGLKRWVMSFGPDAEVLEPDWLREEVKTELSKAIATYSS
ncbi:MAG: WYL domain-containing protein [Rectinemataceae bacterium]